MRSDQVIQFLCDSSPRRVWEMDKNTLSVVRQYQDDNGTFLWVPEPKHAGMPGSFLGVQVSIAKDVCFQIRYIFPDGQSYVVKYDHSKYVGL